MDEQVNELPELIPYRRKDKWGFCDRNKNLVIGCIYDYVTRFYYGLAIVRKSRNYYFIDQSGKIVSLIYKSFVDSDFEDEGKTRIELARFIKPAFEDEVEQFQYNYLVIRINNEFERTLVKIVSKQAFILPYKVSPNASFSEKLIAININSKYGYISVNGELIVPAIYDSAANFEEGLALVHLNDKCGFINKLGTIVIPIEYDSCYDFSSDFVIAKKSDVYRILNRKGEEILLPKYSYVGGFVGGLAHVNKTTRTGRLQGFINEEGKEIYPLNSDLYNGEYFMDGLMKIERNKKYGYINKLGEQIISPKYDYADFEWKNGLAAVGNKINGKNQYGYINQAGIEIIPLMYDNASRHNKQIAVKMNGKWACMDSDGNLETAFVYDEPWVDLYNHDLTIIQVDNKWGFQDKNGNIIISPIYESARRFHEGLAGVKKEGRWGFVYKNGEVAIPFLYDWIWDFNSETAAVKINDKIGRINKQGKVIVPINFLWIGGFQNGLALVKQQESNMFDYIDENGTRYWEDEN